MGSCQVVVEVYIEACNISLSINLLTKPSLQGLS